MSEVNKLVALASAIVKLKLPSESVIAVCATVVGLRPVTTAVTAVEPRARPKVSLRTPVIVTDPPLVEAMVLTVGVIAPPWIDRAWTVVAPSASVTVYDVVPVVLFVEVTEYVAYPVDPRVEAASQSYEPEAGSAPVIPPMVSTMRYS